MYYPQVGVVTEDNARVDFGSIPGLVKSNTVANGSPPLRRSFGPVL